MITAQVRFSRLVATTGLILAAALTAQAQPVFVDWTGAVDSNYFNAGNWSSNVVPGATSQIRMTGTTAIKTLDLAYAGTGDTIVNIWGLQTGVRSAYTLNLSGTANGWLNYNIVGRGAAPYYADLNTLQTFANTGATATRLPFFVNIGSYARITANGSTAIFGAGQSGLAQANIRMTGNAEMDLSQAGSLSYTYVGTSTVTTTPRTGLEIGGLQMESGTTVYLGTKGLTLQGHNAAGETYVMAGRVIQNAPTSGTPVAAQKWGTGIILMSGTMDYPGIFNLRSGQYLVDGNHNGPITVQSSGSLLGGRGTITWQPAAVAGVVAPAVIVNQNTTITPAGRMVSGTAGTLTINGNVTGNGIFSFDVFSLTKYDRLNINGDLTLGTTSVLAVGLDPAFPLKPGIFRIMNVSGEIIGSFGSVSLPISQGLGASYVLSRNIGAADYIDVIFTQLAFGTNPQLSNNHSIIASQIDRAVAQGYPISGDFLESLNRQPSLILFRQELDQLSPTAYYGWYPAAVVRANAMAQTVEDRLEQSGPRNKGSVETYSTVYRQESSIGATSVGDYTNFDTMSISAGLDYNLSSNLTIGGLMDYSYTNHDLDTMRSTGTVKSYTGAIYAQSRLGNWKLQAMGFAGKDEYEAQRNVAVTTMGTWSLGETTGQRYGASVYAAHTTKFSWIDVTPNVGFQVLDWSANKFTETGAGDASLVICYQQETSMASLVGLRLSHDYPTKRGTIRPYVNVRWQHEFNAGKRELAADLFGERMIVRAPGIQAEGLRVDAGLDWNVTQNAMLQVRYAVEQGGAADESLGLRAGVNVAF